MTGIILDSILMLLLAAAIGYGIKLEKKLKALRDGQLAFAGAVSELNSAAGRAEQALATLRASGHETDLLHDRIIKARAVKQELEVLIARAPAGLPVRASQAEAREEPVLELNTPTSQVSPLLDDESRARRMASLMERIEGARAVMKAPAARPAPASAPAETFAPVRQALAANHAAQQSLNRARRSLDEDLFAA
ncbi:hypothetical protein HNP32_000009 [Brevundimonas bullata]|uniref:DUF6468 domain-containing protein n=1 Tax=Brevundimonas bullata TaxID=13160 RepID=A0A7W7N1J5_9CAUL|nr:DUF6468 domain-containing protein [Brevundimonas bullata]MBB4796295.1 hypothetical protein [Brevundimonas bullata]MBB6381255.1 hypothetical protein [Brevundimonas bullata]